LHSYCAQSIANTLAHSELDIPEAYRTSADKHDGEDDMSEIYFQSSWHTANRLEATDEERTDTGQRMALTGNSQADDGDRAQAGYLGSKDSIPRMKR
jgi:hypothetical protein